MWNFLVFLLLPSSTILGPITGGALYSKKNFANFFIRRFFFPVFYKISEFILLAKYKKSCSVFVSEPQKPKYDVTPSIDVGCVPSG